MNITTNSSALNATATVLPTGQSPYITEPGWVETFRLTFQVLLALIGVVGNVLVVLVITLQPKMKTVVNNLLCNLAIADICILVLCFPSGIIKEQAMYHWPLGEFVCRAIFPFLDVFYGVSVWSIASIAIDRYNALVCMKRPNKERALKRARFTMVLIWIVSFVVISLPLYGVTKLDDNSPAYVICTTTWPNEATRKAYLLGVFLFWYVIPLIVVIWTFLRISKKLHSSTKFNKRISRDLCSDPADAESPKMRIRERQNIKAKRILVPVVVVFTLTMFPMNAFRLAIAFEPAIIYDAFFWVYYHIALTLVVANSAANCFIYSIVSKEFRQGFRQLFRGTGQRLSHLVSSPLFSYRKRKSGQKTKSSVV